MVPQNAQTIFSRFCIEVRENSERGTIAVLCKLHTDGFSSLPHGEPYDTTNWWFVSSATLTKSISTGNEEFESSYPLNFPHSVTAE